MITVLLYVAATSAGLLVLLLLLSLLGGLDLDLDLGGSVDMDADAGGLGAIKGLLAFLGAGSWVVRIALLADQHPIAAYAAGVVAGIVVVFLLQALLRWLLRNQVNTNWHPHQALHQEAKVYLRIPGDTSGTGLIRVSVNGADRELKARTHYALDIPTGARVLVESMEDDLAVVIPYDG